MITKAVRTVALLSVALLSFAALSAFSQAAENPYFHCLDKLEGAERFQAIFSRVYNEGNYSVQFQGETVTIDELSKRVAPFGRRESDSTINMILQSAYRDTTWTPLELTEPYSRAIWDKLHLTTMLFNLFAMNSVILSHSERPNDELWPLAPSVWMASVTNNSGVAIYILTRGMAAKKNIGKFTPFAKNEPMPLFFRFEDASSYAEFYAVVAVGYPNKLMFLEDNGSRLKVLPYPHLRKTLYGDPKDRTDGLLDHLNPLKGRDPSHLDRVATVCGQTVHEISSEDMESNADVLREINTVFSKELVSIMSRLEVTFGNQLEAVSRWTPAQERVVATFSSPVLEEEFGSNFESWEDMVEKQSKGIKRNSAQYYLNRYVEALNECQGFDDKVTKQAARTVKKLNDLFTEKLPALK